MKKEKENLMNYLGIDIGGTFIKYAIVDKNIHIIKKWKKETKHFTNADDFYDYVCSDIDSSQIDLIGVSAPGVINQLSEVLTETSPNTKIMYQTCINQEIKKRLVKETYSINDAKAAGFCELKLGSAKGTKSSAFMIIGTGIGGCLCDEYGIINGNDSLAGELSCLPFNIEDGKIISASHFASMTALIEIYNHMSPKKEKYGKDICEKYLHYDETALKAMEKWILNICFVLNILTLCYNPEVICIGGGISEEEWFIQNVQKKYDGLFPSRFHSVLTAKIKQCKYHNEANLLGAILYAKSQFNSSIE